MFDNHKLQHLSRDDKSGKGSVDKPILPIVRILNQHQDYYTTSSCSGRIGVLSEEGKKGDVKWHLKAHHTVDVKEVMNCVQKINEDKVWFREESMILHVCCRDLDSAKKLMKAAHSAGLKHSGIISIGNRIVVEIMGNEFMNLPLLMKDLSSDYIEEITEQANKKLASNFNRLKRFREKLKKM